MTHSTRALLLIFVASTWPFDSAGATPPESEDPPAGTPQVTIDATRQDLGPVEPGTVVSESFVIGNVGTAPLAIESVEPSSTDVHASVPQSIPPGSSAELVIDWDTADTTGEAEAQVVLQLNDPAQPNLVVSLDCVVGLAAERKSAPPSRPPQTRYRATPAP